MDIDRTKNKSFENDTLTKESEDACKSTILKIREIPYLGFIVWWFYMILKTPEKINKLFEATSVIKNLEENIARLSSDVAELQRRTEPVVMEENLLLDTKPYSDSVCLSEENSSRVDENLFYLSFENVFRGSENDISVRQEKYLSYSIEAYNSTGKCFLDAGCGRGEFLRILKKASVSAKGLDINSLSCDNLKKQSFDVECVDVNAYLEALDRYSLSGISALQLIEHMTDSGLKKFISLASDKIAEGGVIILETVNIKHLSSLSNFYLDMSHKKPIPPELIKFLLEWYNFKDIQILYSSPCTEELRVKKFHEYNYMDYAIIGWKR